MTTQGWAHSWCRCQLSKGARKAKLKNAGRWSGSKVATMWNSKWGIGGQDLLLVRVCRDTEVVEIGSEGSYMDLWGSKVSGTELTERILSFQDLVGEWHGKTSDFKTFPKILAIDPGYIRSSHQRLILFLLHCWKLNPGPWAWEPSTLPLSCAQPSVFFFWKGLDLKP